MDIKAKKIKLIEWIIGVNDISLLEQLSNLRSKSVKDAFEKNMDPLSVDELKNRAIKSNKNIEDDEVYDIEEILR